MIGAAQEYCKKVLTTTRCRHLPFHNIYHTQEVVNQVQIIGKNINLTPEELEPIVIAAWFHDTGFSETYNGHEDFSIQFAKDFLRQHSYPVEKTDTVISCIEATKIPQNPTSIYAEVLSDADIFHISNDVFFYRKLLLRREWEMEFDKYSTDLEWHLLNLKFLQDHQFFTEYGQEVLMKGQKKNEIRVQNLISLY